MNIEEYFNEIQEYVKQHIEDKSQIDNIIHSLNDDNIQAVINQDYNNNVSIEESGEKLIKQKDLENPQNEVEQNHITGNRGINTMEQKILRFNDFINERKK